MNKLTFAQIRKVDVENRLVFGRAAQEHPDKSGEIMDYESSKPNFQRWSDLSKDATNGASFGNVRAMHGKVAAGKLTDLQFNDDEMAIDVCAKIVDNNEWQKVLEGVYTGFSIGGSYAKRWGDGSLTRYTADPTELSLVDRPCIPTATFFEVQKADGVIEKVEFKAPAQEDVIPDVKGSFDEVVEFSKYLNENNLSMGDALEKLRNPEQLVKAFADIKNKKFPIDNEDQIRAAWTFLAKNPASYSDEELAGIKSIVEAAWAEIIGGKPDATEKMVKSVGMIPSFTEILTSINYLAASVDFEEGVTGTFAVRLRAVFKDLGDVLVEYTLKAIDDAAKAPGSTQSVAGYLALAEQASELLKVGSRNNKEDAITIQEMHDNAVKLGASCTANKVAAQEDLNKALSDAMEPLSKALDAAKAKIAQLESEPAPAKVVLRAVEKGSDIPAHVGQIKKVIDPYGNESESATLIKSIHGKGGQGVKF